MQKLAETVQSLNQGELALVIASLMLAKDQPDEFYQLLEQQIAGAECQQNTLQDLIEKFNNPKEIKIAPRQIIILKAGQVEQVYGPDRGDVVVMNQTVREDQPPFFKIRKDIDTASWPEQLKAVRPYL